MMYMTRDLFLEEKRIENDIKLNDNINIAQNNFLENELVKTINTAIDIGIKAVLPDLIEDEIINIKDAILEQGFKEGINQVINSSINLGKSVIGIFTGNFENISQVQNAVKSGGIIDNISNLLDSAIKIANNKNLINNTIATMLKQGKNTILKSVSNKIEETLTNQLKAVEKLENYCEKWNMNYENKNFNEMEKAYKNIEKYLNTVMPLENIINKARNIENTHSLIKNNGNNFNLSEDEIKLSEKLATI